MTLVSGHRKVYIRLGKKSYPIAFHKPISTLRQLLTNVKDKDKTGEVHVINSSIQDYVHRDDHTQPAYEMAPEFTAFLVLMFIMLPSTLSTKLSC